MTGVLKKLFGDLSTFSHYAPGVETSMDLDDLGPSGYMAERRVKSLISIDVFNSITADMEEYEPLRSAMANLTLNRQLVFDAVSRRKNGVDVYKYELEAMQRSYQENYFNAMDALIQLVANDAALKSSWQKTRYYLLLSSCQITSAEEFDMIYPIDLSYLFFFRIVPLQKECLDERLATYFAKTTDTHIVSMIKLALAKKTVAKALRRFDILEFPPTIKNLFEDNTATRSGKDESDRASALADQLDSEADNIITNVDSLMNTDSSSDDSSYSSLNEPDDKIIMFP
jgi:hypothetical protein